MNTTNSSKVCSLLKNEKLSLESDVVILLCVAFNLVTCPVTILMNVLVIVAVKTRKQLQSVANIMLACLASTDLLVGIVSQPLFIIAQILLLTGSFTAYCNFYNMVTLSVNLSVLTSLNHLALISIERYLAMKYALRYESIVTKSRVTAAVVGSWSVVVVYVVYVFAISGETPFLALSLMVLGNLIVIAFCHISVYLVSRRHRLRIISELVSKEVIAAFLEKKKAWITTAILVGAVCLSFLLGLVNNLSRIFITGGMFVHRIHSLFIPTFFTCVMSNALINPIIYCWRIRHFRRAIIELVTRKNLPELSTVRPGEVRLQTNKNNDGGDCRTVT